MPRRTGSWETKRGNRKFDMDMAEGRGTYNIGDKVRVKDKRSAWYLFICVVVGRYVRVTNEHNHDGYYEVEMEASPGGPKRTFTTAGLMRYPRRIR